MAAALEAIRSIIGRRLPISAAEARGEHPRLLSLKKHTFHGQWTAGTVPKLTPFKYWNKLWEVKVSNFPFMGWGLFALEPAKARDQLLPFVGETYSNAEFQLLWELNPRFQRYVLWVEDDVYLDGDIGGGNIAGFINSSKGRMTIGNVLWKYYPLLASWNARDWGYMMIVAVRNIAEGEELYCDYPWN
jgi:hypothetical protein